MIVISQADMDLIRNRRIRKRTLTLPVRVASLASARHPKTGRVLGASDVRGSATRRCPVREGGSYTLQARVPDAHYERWVAESSRQPTRARAVLWLMERCERPRQTLRITVQHVERHGAEWHITFSPDSKEELRELLASDQPVYLARGRDYTTVRDELDAGEVLMPLREDLEAARRKAREGRAVPQREALAQAREALQSCREVMDGIKRRNRLSLALKEVERAAAEVDAVAADTLCQSDRAARQASAA